MGFGTGLMKTLMFVFNGIVWVLGLVLFVVGIVVLVEGKNWNEIVDNKTVPVSVMLLVVGLIIAIVGFLGCFGAMKQNGTMLLIYAIVLGIIIILQCVAGILAFIFSDETEEIVSKKMSDSLKTYSGDTNKTSDHLFNIIMEEFDCCGMTDYNDWATKTSADEWTKANVPDSCCVKMTSRCGWSYFTTKEENREAIHKEGCLTKFVEAVDKNYKIAGICAIVFLVIQVIQIILACCLRSDAKGVLA